jgi:hypothetical protein
MLRALPSGRRRLARAALLAATVLSASAPPASADVTVSAAKLSGISAPNGLAVDRAASGSRAARLRSTRPATAIVVLPAPVTSIALRVRGVTCDGAPSVRFAVDGDKLPARSVARKRYVTVTYAHALTAGRHRIGVALASAARTGRCRRAVVVDTIRLRVAASPTSRASAPSAADAADGLLADAVTGISAVVPGLTTAPPPTPTPPATTPTPTPPATTPTPTTPTPTTPTPPPAPVDTRAKLRWAPPALASPTTIVVAQGDQNYALEKTKDYIIDLGAETHFGTVKLSGGRNVTMIGGHIALPSTSTQVVALNIRAGVGTVHVEGLEIDGTSGHEMDAIAIQAPDAVVQVQNVRADGVRGSFDTNHSDVIQPWGGVKALRVDRLTADSNYQGIYTRPDQGAIGAVDLRHVDMAFNDSAATSSGGFLLWMTNGCDMAPTSLSDVYIKPRTGKTIGAAVWPPSTDANCPAKVSAGKVTWPSLPVTGAVSGGVPAGGSFVPAGSVGLGYSSPGYQ